MVSITKRRRFQTPITSFFFRESQCADETSTCQQGQQTQEEPSSPLLPDEVQSSLLTVGMRIRKSVPEGYKTHKTVYSRFSSDHLGSSFGSGMQDYPSITTSSSIYQPGHAELAPFCGLHKIGGMAVQPMPRPSSGVSSYQFSRKGAEQADEPDPWSLPSSQESINSNAPSAPSNKRTLTFDQEDDNADDWGHEFSDRQTPSIPFSHTEKSDLNPFFSSSARQSLTSNNINTNSARAFAIPRSRFPSSKDKRPALEGQENPGSKASELAPGFTTASDQELDFGDAIFLRARDDVDTDDIMDGSFDDPNP